MGRPALRPVPGGGGGGARGSRRDGYPVHGRRGASQLEEEVRATRRLGFTGKAAIHPTQVPIIQGAFSPPPDAVAWARRIVAAYQANEGGVLLVDGKLIERPVIASAQRILDAAGAVDRAGENG